MLTAAWPGTDTAAPAMGCWSAALTTVPLIVPPAHFFTRVKSAVLVTSATATTTCDFGQ